MLLSLRTQCVLTCNKNLILKGVWGTITMRSLKWFDLCNKNIVLLKINWVISAFFFLWKTSFLLNLVGVCYRWIFQLTVFGLGFKAFYARVFDKFRVDLGFSHIFQLNALSTKLIFIKHKKLYGKRTMLIFSICHSSLYALIFNMLKMRPQGRYKMHGFNIKKIFFKPLLKKKIQKKSYR